MIGVGKEENRIIEHIKTLSKDILIYGTGRVAIPFIGIITLPILTRFFSPADYGVIEGIATISSIIALFSSLMLESGTQRNYYDYKENEEIERKRVISTAFWTLIIWDIILFIPILTYSREIGGLFFSQGEFGLPLFISLASIPVITLFNFLKEIYRLHNQPIKYSFFSATHAAIVASAVIILVCLFNAGLVGYFLGSALGSAGVFFFIVFALRANILHSFSRTELRKMLHYGLPLIPTSLSIWVLTLSDRFFLLRFTSLGEVGLYAIGVKLTQLILLFVTAFGLAWSPFILSIYARDKEEEKRVRGKIVTYYIFFLGFLAVFLTAFSKPILLLFTTKDFLDADKVIGILALATAASGASQALCTGINIARQTKFLAIYSGIAALLNIFLNAIIVPFLGFLGSAIAMAISYHVLCILYYRKSQELYFSPYEPEKIIKIAILSFLLVLAGPLLSKSEILTGLLIKAMLFFCFPILCFMWKVFDKQEILALKRVVFKNIRQR